MENSTTVEIIQDLRQSEEYGNFMEKIGWKTKKINGLHIFIKKLGPVSIAKIQRADLPLPWPGVENILKSERVMMCIAEPKSGRRDEMTEHGFKVSREPLLGTKTLRVNLSLNAEEILSSFKKDARYCIKKAQTAKYGLQINEFNLFYEIWKKSAKRKNLWIPKERDYFALIECFGKNVFCITAEAEAGALVLINKRTAFYYYAGGTGEGTRMNLPYLIVWEAIKEAKNRKCEVWDFEGIFDTRWPNKGWQGFTHFKKSFGGTEVEFPGSFIKWRWPFQFRSISHKT